MAYNDYMNGLMVLISQAFLGSYVMMLTEFREPVHKWKRLWIFTVILIVGVNIALILFGDFWHLYTRIGVLTVTLPYILITLLCSKHRGLPVLFNICTCIWIGCIGNANGVLAHSLLPDNTWIHTVMRGLTYLAMYMVVRRFRKYYWQMLQLLEKGWGILCLIPVVTFFVTLLVINVILPESPLSGAIIIYGVMAVCTFSYMLIYLFFVKVLQEYELKSDQELINAQITALKRQLDANQEAEEMMRIQRHDMRHKWMTLSALIKQGDKQAALDFIKAEQKLP